MEVYKQSSIEIRVDCTTAYNREGALKPSNVASHFELQYLADKA